MKMDIQAFDFVIGADEVGRGCLAGPLVASAVAIRRDNLKKIEEIVDSKAQTKDQRVNNLKKLLKFVEAYTVISLPSAEINRIGIKNANKKVIAVAVNEVLSRLENQKVLVLIDHVEIEEQNNRATVISLPKADANFKPVALAATLAKVLRDLMLLCLEEEFFNFSFSKHKGYGTREHLKELLEHDSTPVHRKTYKPVCQKRLFYLPE